jgi:hypothetical protein
MQTHWPRPRMTAARNKSAKFMLRSCFLGDIGSIEPLSPTVLGGYEGAMKRECYVLLHPCFPGRSYGGQVMTAPGADAPNAAGLVCRTPPAWSAERRRPGLPPGWIKPAQSAADHQVAVPHHSSASFLVILSIRLRGPTRLKAHTASLPGSVRASSAMYWS